MDKQELVTELGRIRTEIESLCEQIPGEPESKKLLALTNRISGIEDAICDLPDNPTTGQLGQRGEEAITGFTGIATQRTQFISGQVMYFLEREKDETVVSEWFDEGRITWLTGPEVGKKAAIENLRS